MFASNKKFKYGLANVPRAAMGFNMPWIQIFYDRPF
jgi:hypothetical protein